MSTLSSNFDDPVQFKKGKVLFAEGEPSSFLYIVLSGEVRIFKENKSRLIPISVIKEKDFIGELSMFNDEPRSATAIATEQTEVMIIKKAEIRKVIKECPDWVTNIMVTLSDRLRNTVDVLREHRIEDDMQEAKPLSDQDMAEFQKSIEEYKTRRGL